ncbi:hypothetical protein QVN91_01320 [Bacteroides caecigallinarum]|nr:hypothetical protein [Bacteroides caecigallinarum]
MKKLVIVSQAPLTPQIKRNTYIEEFIVAKFDVEFWDVSQILHQGLKLVDELNEDYLIRINNLVDLKKLIVRNNNKNTIYIFDFDPNWKRLEFFKLFSQNNCCTIRIDMYANTGVRLSFFQKFMKLFSDRGFILVKTKISNSLCRLYSSYKGIKPFDYFLTSSSLVYSDKKINHPDYEEFRFNKSCKVLDYNYILFIDTYFGYHPDFIYFNGYKKMPNVDNYFNVLNNYFQFLERKYKMPVVIALHPKSDYKNDEFKGRLCIKYKTKDLMCFADKVILQLCNTTSWLTLANKEVVFITTNDYDKVGSQKKDLRFVAKDLDKKVYNIENMNYEEIFFEKIDNKLREKYIYSYLTSKDIENKKNIDILSEFFDKIIIK